MMEKRGQTKENKVRKLWKKLDIGKMIQVIYAQQGQFNTVNNSILT